MKLFIFLIALSFSNLTLAQDSNFVEETQKLAEQGDVEAQHSLGIIYANGQGVPQNYELALKWYQKAARQGHAEAQNDLGHLYFSGAGVSQNYEEALKWFQKAARQGYARAQHNIGVMYYHGQGVAQNYREAFYWFQQAAMQGYTGSLHTLASMFSYGHGVPRSPIYAYAYVILARTYGIEFPKDFIYNFEASLSPKDHREAQRISVEIFHQIEQNRNKASK